jgi:hypothetical protein
MEVRWQAVGSTTIGTVHIDRYVLHHSRYLEMPLLHFYSEGSHPKGGILWFSLHGKASREDWPQISKLLNDGYEVFSFDFRGLGETSMKFRVDSSGTSAPDGFDEAYANPLDSVLAGYVYNSLLTGRPYFLQMMDDLKIAQLFIRSLNPREPLTLAATGEAYSLAVRFQEVDPEVSILKQESAPVLNWSTLVAQGQEQWPIAFIMPNGAAIRAK